jgi:hypothetical protein
MTNGQFAGPPEMALQPLASPTVIITPLELGIVKEPAL